MSDRQSTIWSPVFIRFWGGATASGFATWGLTFLLGLAVTQGLLTATELGIALSIRTIGFLAGVLFGGSFADRIGPRIVIFVTGLLAAAATGLIMAGLQLDGYAAAATVFGGTALAGVGQGGCRPAYQAMLPTLVASPNRQSANAAMSLSLNIALFAGPALATLLTLYAGITITFAIFGVAWLVSALCPPWISSDVRAGSERTKYTLIADIRAGLQEAGRHRWFAPTLAALSAVIAGGYSVTNVILPVVSQQVTSGPTLMAQCITAYTFGGIVGAFVVARVTISARARWALAGLGAYGLAPLGLLFAQSAAMPIIAYFMAGFGIHCFNILWFTTIQDEVSPDKIARVSSLDFLCSYGLAPVGLAVVAPLAAAIGVSAVLWISAALCILAPLTAFRLSGGRFGE